MTDTKIQPAKIGDARLAEKVVDAYANDLEGLTPEECMDLDIGASRCTSLAKALGKGPEGIVIEKERKELFSVGFSKAFINGIAGTDGKKALMSRVRWLADHCVTRWWRWDADVVQRVRMIDELGDIGPPAAAAVDSLAEALQSKELFVPTRCSVALGKIGAASIPELLKTLANTEGQRSLLAADALAAIGPATASAVPALILLLKSSDPIVRANTAYVLQEIGPAAASAVPALIQAVDDEHSAVRWSSVPALGGIGPAAAPAVPALIKTLKDKNKDMRRKAARALGRIGPAARHAVPTLERMRDNDSNADCRKVAAEAIEKIAED